MRFRPYILILISCVFFFACHVVKKYPYEKIDDSNTIRIMVGKGSKGKTVNGVIYNSPTTFTTIYISNISCDSIFLFRQKAEKIDGSKKKLRTYTSKYLLCEDSSCVEKLTSNEILLLDKVLSVNKEFSICNTNFKRPTSYKFIGKKKTWKK